MASYLLATSLFFLLFSQIASSLPKRMQSFDCSPYIQTCSALLYQQNVLQMQEISQLYNVKKSEITPIFNHKQDYLVNVPCSCRRVNGTLGYFYNALYETKQNDTFASVSDQLYSGQIWPIEMKGRLTILDLDLVCGCLAEITVVTYTVQESDTLKSIAALLASEVADIVNLNPYLASNPAYLGVGWVLYVPMTTA